LPRGIAADPDSGHVFVADQGNRRIDVFTAYGAFERAWGWDVVEGGGSGFEICVRANGDKCKKGAEGTGAGEFGLFGPQGIAVDSAGNVYVVDFFNRRVEKFDAEGHFLFSFGSSGTGSGQFSWPTTFVGSFITIDTNETETAADDAVYVGDVSRVERFDVNGTYVGEISLPGRTVQSLATDASGNLYAAYFHQNDVHKIAPTGEELVSPRFKVESPTAVAVDPVGDVYAFGPVCSVCSGSEIPADPIYKFGPDGKLGESFGIEEFAGATGLATNLCAGDESPGDLYVSNAATETGPSESQEAFVRAYGPPSRNCGKAITDAAKNLAETAATLQGQANPRGETVSECLFEYGIGLDYGQTVECAESPGEIGEGSKPVPVHADIGGLDRGSVYHFRLRVGSAGGAESGSDESFKTLGPPVLSGEAAASVAYTEATLSAKVNPEGFPTSYRFEYGIDATYDHATPEITIGSSGDRAEHAVSANLTGLDPGRLYHWRIVAGNSSSENAGHRTESGDHIFITYLEPQTQSDCSNQSFRIGAAAQLPDCRAYEMISPVDKNGDNILREFEGNTQSTDEGDRITYSAGAAFGDLHTAVVYNQYLANRDSGSGWSNRGVHPPVAGEELEGAFFGIFREFEAFSPDLCNAWFRDLRTPPLTPAGQEDYPNLYRLDLCGGEEAEALTSVAPPGGTSVGYVGKIEGYSADGGHAFFSAAAPLADGAASGAKFQTYDRFGGTLHLVSVKANGAADTNNTAIGSGVAFNVQNAISADGGYVYWTSIGNSDGIGRIFLRAHPRQGKVEGECSEPAKACTVAASTGTQAFFWAAAADGSGVVYGEEGEGGEKLWLQEFELSAEKTVVEAKKNSRRLIAEHVMSVLGASDDLSRIYFISTDALTPGQEDGVGREAVEGEPNLYLEEGGALTYVATLSQEDVQTEAVGEGRVYSFRAKKPFYRAARVSPDGTQLAFESQGSLTGFDNIDPESGEADLEVFTYQAGGRLDCVSCSPSGASPSGPELHEPFLIGGHGDPTHVFAAAWIPTWEHPLYASRVISDDGKRLFFNSYEDLTPSDTNRAMDVYEWEKSGAGSCEEESAAFHQANGGCLYSISSGTSPFESEFWDASADGNNVFFNTESSLVPQDPGLVDLYDARVGGGFAPPPSPPAPCEGEACQGPSSAPLEASPGSAEYRGPGNLADAKARRCRKGKRKKMRRKGGLHCAPKGHQGRGHAHPGRHPRRAERGRGAAG